MQPIPKRRLYHSDSVSKYHPFKSTKFAFAGLVYAFRTEPNLVIQLMIGLSFFLFNLFAGQLILAVANLIFMAITMGFEIFNTALENICDLVNPELNNRVKIIKDLSAGAVLIVALVWLLIIVFSIVQEIFHFNFREIL